MPPTGHGEFVVPVGTELSGTAHSVTTTMSLGIGELSMMFWGVSLASCSLQIGMCSEVGIHVSTDGDND
jgi:hypothetical protein